MAAARDYPVTNSTLRRHKPMPKGTQRGHNSTLRPGRKPLKNTRHRKAFRHLRDPKFRAFVRVQGCQCRGLLGHVCRTRVEFAHIANEGNGGADRGNGLGLCAELHRTGAKSWHVMGKHSFPAYWGIDPVAIAKALDARYALEESGFGTNERGAR